MIFLKSVYVYELCRTDYNVKQVYYAAVKEPDFFIAAVLPCLQEMMGFSLRFHQVRSLAPYVNRFIKQPHQGCISREISSLPLPCSVCGPPYLPPIVSMLYCHCQQSLKHSPPPELQRNQGDKKRRGKKTQVFRSRPLTKSDIWGSILTNPTQ